MGKTLKINNMFTLRGYNFVFLCLKNPLNFENNEILLNLYVVFC